MSILYLFGGEKVLTIIGDAAKEELRLALGDMEAWLETKIEYYVNRNKQL